ncbi:MAG: nicotinate-nicotinamide nucleotide adenylyltransferase [Helicobacter sp.]|nr:nicotinate-nicotinamide nucleotide adenylyltransferase [Helicobacter sp.]
MPQVATIPDYVMFGGSFDPPHVGHSAIAERLCALGAQRLFVVPAFLSPFKTTSLFCARLRLRWANIVFDNPKIVISDFEIARGAPTPSLQTLEYLQTHFHIDSAQKIGIVIGADHLARLHEWFGFESLRQRAVFVVFARPNAQSDAAILQTIDFCWVAFCCPCSSTQIRQALHVGNREILQWLDSRIADEVWQAVLKK